MTPLLEMNREEKLNTIRSHYIGSRVSSVDSDFLEFEELMTEDDDLLIILNHLNTKKQEKLANTYNSILLYITGITDEFDFRKGRADTTGGSPPDIDSDYAKLGRDLMFEKVAEKWGRERVANIVTHLTFKPKSILNRWEKTMMPNPKTQKHLVKQHYQTRAEIDKMIPPAIFGKEATLKEIVEGDTDKNYKAHPELKDDPKYKSYYDLVSYFEEMVQSFGIHAAGLIIASEPIYEHIPMWNKADMEGRITQFDMIESESLGLLKFDFLTIVNLDIIQEAFKHIKETYNKDYTLQNVPRNDKKTYDLLASGSLSGIFQFETSDTAKDLITRIKPQNILELSDINAMNRPGPLKAEFHEKYIENRSNGYAPADMPAPIAKILKGTYWTLLYQEQVMQICSEIAGYSLKEADDIRRAMGKKKKKVLVPYKKSFLKGFRNYGLSEKDGEKWWDILMGFSDYGFNKSHSVVYSLTSYICAYLKANYPAQFFTALMTIRSAVEQPKNWAQKAPQFNKEAKTMGVYFLPPDINLSSTGFKIIDKHSYFGFSSIRQIGTKLSDMIIEERDKNGKYNTIWDFVERTSISTSALSALTIAGALDCFGFSRQSILDNIQEVAYFHKKVKEFNEHVVKQKERKSQNILTSVLKEELDILIKEAKNQYKHYKKDVSMMSQKDIFLLEKKNINSLDPTIDYEQDFKNELKVYANLRKLPELKDKEFPIRPTLRKATKLTLQETIDEAKYIGCFLTDNHPAEILFPDCDKINQVAEGEYHEIAGAIIEADIKTTRNGGRMAILQIGDGTEIAKAVVFPNVYSKLTRNKISFEEFSIVKIGGYIKSVEPEIEITVRAMAEHRSIDE